MGKGDPRDCRGNSHGRLDRSLATAGKYVLSIHAERERQADRITTLELEAVLNSCEMLEDYPDDSRGHSCLVLGFANARPIHAVCAVKDDPREVLLITYRV
jgi:hypothetical protein